MSKNVIVDYTLKISGSDEVFDTSVGKTPIKFKTGEGLVIEGFEKAVLSLNKGETKTFVIDPNEAYGHVDESLIRSVNRNQVPSDVKEGQELRGLDSDGREFIVYVKSVNEETVIVDGNHPLAGKELIYDISLVDIEEE